MIKDCGAPPNVAGATVHGTGKVRQYVCDSVDDDGQHLYPKPGTGNGTITCDEASSDWNPTGFECGGSCQNIRKSLMLPIFHLGQG